MKSSEAFDRLIRLMAKLREPGGCPWDCKQTHETLRPYCLEEAYEVVEAIDMGDSERLRDELGDLLLQVVFHARLAEEAGTFSIDDVVEGIHDKLIRRHPHVFRKSEGYEAATPEQVLERWQEIKRSEGRTRVLGGIPSALPALLRAQRVGEKAAQAGFDWQDADSVWKKVDEEMDELRRASLEAREEELGDLFFALTSLARHLGIDSEGSLRHAVEKFTARFTAMEEEADRLGTTVEKLGAEDLDALWNRVKASS